MSLWKGLMSLCMVWLIGFFFFLVVFAIFVSFVWLFLMGFFLCLNVVFSFIHEDCVLLVSVCHPTEPVTWFFF